MAFAYIKARTLGLQIIFKKQNEITTGILIFQNIFFSIYLMDMFFV